MATNLYLNEKLLLFEQLLTCGTNIKMWQYGTDGHLIGTNSDYLVLDQIFERSGCKPYMIQQSESYSAPMILGGKLGMMWCAVFDRSEGHRNMIYVLGPVFNAEIATASIEQTVATFNLPLHWRQDYLTMMRGLPVVSSVLFFQYALMLHYCVTGEKLSRSDLHFQKWNPNTSADAGQTEPERSRMQVWLAERALLSMVREGNINYQNVFSNAGLMSDGVKSGSNDPVLQAVISCTSFTSLCVREAIQAGISPDTAYKVGDSYIQSMVQCKTVTELRSINHAMYEDFIMRVHKHRTNPKVSVQIQHCRDYIESHPDQPLTLAILSKQTGYSEYHLSRKFKQEMGISISAYIKISRVERAKLLLTATNDPISKIALDLQFSSSSHFSDVFQKVTGKKPQQYRLENQKVVFPK